MNTAHVVAWLTCLILAFFACILAVRNAGSVLNMRNDVEQMEKELKEADKVAGGLYEAQVERIRQSVKGLREEASTLRELHGKASVEEMGHELDVLEDRLKALEAELAPLLKEEPKGSAAAAQPREEKEKP